MLLPRQALQARSAEAEQASAAEQAWKAAERQLQQAIVDGAALCQTLASDVDSLKAQKTALSQDLEVLCSFWHQYW